MSNEPCGLPEIHSGHPWQEALHLGIAWCPGVSEADVRESDLLVAIKEAEAANNQRLSVARVGCAMCNALSKMEDPVKSAVEAALAGTIGRDKLVTILRSHGYDVGRRSLERHRQEGHS